MSSNDSIHKPVILTWDSMDYNHWKGYTTGDADGDGKPDGKGHLIIEKLNHQQTKGRFSMTMGNDLGQEIFVEGQFSGELQYIEKIPPSF